tara:strand:- start:506 stop:676 length:171 start_codon:yes stop_codon:yes gene_type:complete
MIWTLLSLLMAVSISGCSVSRNELGFWEGTSKYRRWQCVENIPPYKPKKCVEKYGM